MNYPDRKPRYHYFKPGPNGDRDRRIYELRKIGMTLSAIGVHFGVSRERVRQIVWVEAGREVWELSSLLPLQGFLAELSSTDTEVTHGATA